jgi:hypothetical protein
MRRAFESPRRYLVRAWLWPVLLVIAIWHGWESSVFLVFVLSIYANWSTDIGAYQAAMARREAEQ